MIANLILILIGLFLLYAAFMFWLRQNLVHMLTGLKHNEDVLRKDFEKQRDMVPILLEGLREGQEPTDAWRALVQKRMEFRAPSTLQAEMDFARTLEEFLKSNSSKALNFLDAKKDIEDLSRLIEEQKNKLKVGTATYNQKRKQFPYSLASAIFGLREVADI